MPVTLGRTDRLIFSGHIGSTMALFILRYGEIGLKSKAVRKRFEKALRDNITIRFIEAEKECRMESDWGRIYLWADDETWTAGVLKRTFGIVSFSVAEECGANKEEIGKLAVDTAKPLFRKGMSFRVKARRTGEHKFTSIELGRDIGSMIWVANEHLEPSVNLVDPDLTVYIEVRQNKAFVFTELIRGPGGMPVGTQGKVLALVEKKEDVAAAWLMMKRGCRVYLAAGIDAEVLRKWDPRFRQVEKVDISDAETLARKLKAEGLVLGWSVGLFDDKAPLLRDLRIPVFYPIIGMDVERIGELLDVIEG